jgi:hypothetical protein
MMIKGQIRGIFILLALFLMLVQACSLNQKHLVMGQESSLDEAERLNKKVIELYGQGRYEEAINYA